MFEEQQLFLIEKCVFFYKYTSHPTIYPNIDNEANFFIIKAFYQLATQTHYAAWSQNQKMYYSVYHFFAGDT